MATGEGNPPAVLSTLEAVLDSRLENNGNRIPFLRTNIGIVADFWAGLAPPWVLIYRKTLVLSSLVIGERRSSEMTWTLIRWSPSV